MAPPPLSSSSASRISRLGRWIDEGGLLATANHLADEPLGEGGGPLLRALEQVLACELACGRGDTGAAQRCLATAEQALLELPEASMLRLEAETRLLLVRARHALRAGQAKEVSRCARLAQARLASLTAAPSSLRFAVLELASTLAITRGAYDRAVRTLTTAADLATDVGDPSVARVQRMLGAIHARCGRPMLAAHAYQIAAARLSEQEQPLEVAKVMSNLAMMSLMAGEISAARDAIERALCLRGAHNAPVTELANSTAVLALVSEREGRAEAAAIWEQAVALTRQGPDRVLTTEIELRAAIAAAERGDPASGEALLALATARCESLGRLEPTVAAMAAEARARLRFAEDAIEEAHGEARRSHGSYAAIDATYHVARIELLLGEIERRRGDHSRSTHWLGSACRLALRGRFELAWRPHELEVLSAAACEGEPDCLRYCRVFGVAVDALAEVLLLDRTGAIEALGKHHTLGRNAMPYRLARALIVAAPEPVSMSTLCRKLWPDEDFDARTVNRLKVHVHRLRDLIGTPSPCVVTESSTRGRVTTTSYRWNPGVSARIVRATTAAPASGRLPSPP